MAVGLGLIAYLSCAKFSRTYDQIEVSRFGAIVLELTSEIEMDMTLGLSLPDMRRLSRELAKTKSNVVELEAIQVVGADGGVLFTEPAGLPSRIPGDWAAAPGIDSQHPYYVFADADRFGLWAPVDDGFGRRAGAVVLTYGRATQSAAVGTVAESLVRIFAMVFAGCTVLAFVAVVLVFRPVSRSFARMTAMLGTRAAGTDLPVPANDLERQMLAFRHSTDDVLADMGAVAGATAGHGAAEVAGAEPVERTAGSLERRHESPFTSRIYRNLLVVVLLLLVVAAGLFSWGAVAVFDRALRPALLEKSATLSEIVARQIGHAVRLGIPLEALPGVQDYMAPMLGANAELAYVAVADLAGRVLYEGGPGGIQARGLLSAHREARPASASMPLGPFIDTASAIPGETGAVGSVHVGVPRTMVEHTLEEMAYDVAVVVVVSLLITFESVLILLGITLAIPVRHVTEVVARGRRGDYRYVIARAARDEVGVLIARLNDLIQSVNTAWGRLVARPASTSEVRESLDRLGAHHRFAGETGPDTLETADLTSIRAPLFLFMFAEELSRSFLPIYVHELPASFLGLSDKLIMGLPIALFMLVATVFTPLAGNWADRFGVRRTLLYGMVPAVIGFIGTAAAQSLVELLIWRSCCAVGYAMMFIAAQGFIAAHTHRQNRARGMATFVGAVIAAGVCGVSIGGILADQIGFRATFLVSAGLALAATLAVARLLEPERQGEIRPRAVRLADYGRILRNPRFFALLAFSSIPTKMMLTGSLFYLTPVSLHELGESQSATGRIMMAYGLIVVLLGPWLSSLADRHGRHALFAGIGGLVAGLGSLAVFEGQGAPVVIISVVTLGLGHAFNNSTQLALVPHVCAEECRRMGRTTVFAVYRLVERAGSVAGPVVAAALAERFGAVPALGLLGGICLVAAVAFCAIFATTTSQAGDGQFGDEEEVLP